jgi:tetratricopeptide (TPR) repeat protein
VLRRVLVRLRCLAAVSIAIFTGGAWCRDIVPPVNPALVARLEAPYLSDDERRDLRIEHGLWTDEDLDTPARRARAAVLAGAYGAGVFDEAGVDPCDAAEAMIARGDPARALAALDGSGSIRAARLRSGALIDLGRFAEADAAIDPVVDRMLRERVEDAGELGEGVRALMLRAMLRGSEREGGGDFRTLKRILETGRDELDRLSWRVRLAEAMLLADKHNPQQAGEAIAEVLGLNPRSAPALRLLAEIAVDGFAFDDAERMAAMLEGLSGSFGVPSLDAGLVRARARLRQRDPAGAGEAIAPLRAVYPDSRALLAMEAAIASAAFDEDRAAALLARFDALAPGSAAALYEVGRTLSDARQYDEAIRALGGATERARAWSRPWIELGLVLIQAGRDGEAKVALEEAVALDPFNARAINSLELVRGLEAFSTVESEHFIVRFRDGVDSILAGEMLAVLERIHARVTADPERIPGGIGHEPAQKTLIELMPSHRWFSVRITGMTQVHTMAAATGPVIAMESPQEGPGFSVGPFDWPRVIQHEYAHTVTLSRTRNRIPHWFTEAAAVFVEDGPRDERSWRVLARAFDTGTLFDLDQINIAFVRPEKASDRAQAYAQGHWMYQYIVGRWGPSAPVRLMDRYASGEREGSAFEGELGLDKAAFFEAFRAWAKEDLRRVGLALPEDVPSIPEMLAADRRESEGEVLADPAFIARWRARHPDHPQLAELQASIRIEALGDEPPERLDEETIAALERFAELVPIAEQPHRLLARHHLAGDDPARAIPHLAFLDAREQHSPVYALELARRASAIGAWDEAHRSAERAASIAPFDPLVREFAARVALKIAMDGRKASFRDAERHLVALTVIEPLVEAHATRLERLRELAAR